MKKHLIKVNPLFYSEKGFVSDFRKAKQFDTAKEARTFAAEKKIENYVVVTPQIAEIAEKRKEAYKNRDVYNMSPFPAFDKPQAKF